MAHHAVGVGGEHRQTQPPGGLPEQGQGLHQNLPGKMGVLGDVHVFGQDDVTRPGYGRGQKLVIRGDGRISKEDVKDDEGRAGFGQAVD